MFTFVMACSLADAAEEDQHVSSVTAAACSFGLVGGGPFRSLCLDARYAGRNYPVHKIGTLAR